MYNGFRNDLPGPHACCRQCPLTRNRLVILRPEAPAPSRSPLCSRLSSMLDTASASSAASPPPPEPAVALRICRDEATLGCCISSHAPEHAERGQRPILEAVGDGLLQVPQPHRVGQQRQPRQAGVELLGEPVAAHRRAHRHTRAGHAPQKRGDRYRNPLIAPGTGQSKRPTGLAQHSSPNSAFRTMLKRLFERLSGVRVPACRKPPLTSSGAVFCCDGGMR